MPNLNDHVVGPLTRNSTPLAAIIVLVPRPGTRTWLTVPVG